MVLNPSLYHVKFKFVWAGIPNNSPQKAREIVRRGIEKKYFGHVLLIGRNSTVLAAYLYVNSS